MPDIRREDSVRSVRCDAANIRNKGVIGMTTPRAKYPEDSTFGKRLREMTAEKIRVAVGVVTRFLSSGSSVFIGDGSSTFYVGLALFERAMKTTIWTNHLGIAHEFPLWASDAPDLRWTEVWLAGGEVDRDLMMTCRDDADACVDRWARKAQSVILSARCLFADRGPAGMEQKSLSIKVAAVKAALQTGARIVFMVDHLKLCKPYLNEPLVFPSAGDWDAAMKNPAVHVVTTRHPQVTAEAHVADPRQETEWFQRNHWVLSRVMKNRYVEV
jgi:DeoR/GlpR family transcriptional regulator of sugar metabolism